MARYLALLFLALTAFAQTPATIDRSSGTAYISTGGTNIQGYPMLGQEADGTIIPIQLDADGNLLLSLGPISIGSVDQGTGNNGTSPWHVIDDPVKTELVSLNAKVSTTLNGVKVDGSGVTQPVSISGSVPVTGTFWQATQPVSISGSVPVTGTFFQATQPVSATSLPLPSGAATDASVVAVTTALGSPFQAGGSIGNTSFGATQPTAANLNATVVGPAGAALAKDSSLTTINTTLGSPMQSTGGSVTATQATGSNLHVVVDTAPTTAVTGTFWQATQPVSAAALPLPSGAATAANQATANTSLASIDSKLTSPLAVSGTVTANIGTSGSLALNSTLSTINTTLGSPFQAGGSIGNSSFGISGTLPAFAATPTFNLGTLNGAATSSLQTTGNTALSTINTTLGAPFQAGGSIGNTSFDATQATAANLNATVVGPSGAVLAKDSSLSTINTTLGSPMQASGGSVTANAGTNLNTSALALESGGHLAAVDTSTTSILANQTNGTQKTQITANVHDTDVSVTGTITSGSGSTSFVSLPINGVGSAIFYVTGNLVGTLQTQLSIDGGTTWTLGTNYIPGQGFFTSVSANVPGYINVAGYTHLRIKAAAYTSGTATVFLNGSSQSFIKQIYSEASSDLPSNSYGRVTTNAPSYSDSTDQKLSLDTSGNLRTVLGTGSATIGSVNSIQSGTWTVQPGNTANTTPWLVKPNDGTTSITVKAASTAPVAADTAEVMAISPNGGNPCENPSATLASITGATSGTSATQIIALSGSTKIYICSMSIIGVSGTTPTFSLVQGTGSNCVTGQTVVQQAFTSTAGQLFQFAAPVAVGVAGNELCYKSTGTSPVQNYTITYVQQ